MYELNHMIEKYARGWRLERISRTAAAIMRCAMCEILYMDDVPNAAAINEAVPAWPRAMKSRRRSHSSTACSEALYAVSLRRKQSPPQEAEAVPSETPGEVLAPSEEGCTEG